MNKYDYKAIALVAFGTLVFACLCMTAAIFVIFPFVHEEKYWEHNPVDDGTYTLMFGPPAGFSILNAVAYAIWIHFHIKKPGYRAVH